MLTGNQFSYKFKAETIFKINRIIGAETKLEYIICNFVPMSIKFLPQMILNPSQAQKGRLNFVFDDGLIASFSTSYVPARNANQPREMLVSTS
uniref:Uncharacterized protein n=1 Tax=Glossina palpalis gambiensis TaxID=67801 RepID=A0A1B0AXX4_9MUSC